MKDSDSSALPFIASLGEVDRRGFMRDLDRYAFSVAIRKLLERRIKVNKASREALDIYREAANCIRSGDVKSLVEAEKYIRVLEAPKA